MIIRVHTVNVPPTWRERYLARIGAGRAIRARHGILAELAGQPSHDTAGSDHGMPPQRRVFVHATDIAADLHTDPLGPGLLAIGVDGLEVESDDQVLLERGMFVYDALYAWCTRHVAAQVATG